jgi:hypothetical protein
VNRFAVNPDGLSGELGTIFNGLLYTRRNVFSLSLSLSLFLPFYFIIYFQFSFSFSQWLKINVIEGLDIEAEFWSSSYLFSLSSR